MYVTTTKNTIDEAGSEYSIHPKKALYYTKIVHEYFFVHLFNQRNPFILKTTRFIITYLTFNLSLLHICFFYLMASLNLPVNIFRFDSVDNSENSSIRKMGKL